MVIAVKTTKSTPSTDNPTTNGMQYVLSHRSVPVGGCCWGGAMVQGTEPDGA